MTKADFVAKLAEKADITKRLATLAYDSMVELLADAVVSEGKFTLSGFGTFTVKTRAARKGVNPSTGAKIEIPARKALTFKASKEIKDSLK